jgi:hypothetical protein
VPASPSIALAGGSLDSDEVALAWPPRAQLTVGAAEADEPDEAAAGARPRDGPDAAKGTSRTTGPAISATLRTNGR